MRGIIVITQDQFKSCGLPSRGSFLPVPAPVVWMAVRVIQA